MLEFFLIMRHLSSTFDRKLAIVVGRGGVPQHHCEGVLAPGGLQQLGSNIAQKGINRN